MNKDHSTLAPLEAVTNKTRRLRQAVLSLIAVLCTALVAALVATSGSTDTPADLQASGSAAPAADDARMSSPAKPVVVEQAAIASENRSGSPGVSTPVGQGGQGGGDHQVEHVDEEVMCSGCGVHGGPLQWHPEPVNTEPDVRVEVIPERPVKGDVVTVRIHWSDAEANLIAAESSCRPVGDDYPSGLCADVFLPPDCPAHGVHELPPPAPGSGVIEFSFTATADRHGWDHGAVLRSMPVPDGNDCAPPDPYEDHLFASGVIEVAEVPQGGDHGGGDTEPSASPPPSAEPTSELD